MRSYALRQSKRRDWFVIDFCSLGFIGKMIRTIDLPTLIIFFLMFANDKPVDWLLYSIGHTKYCRVDESEQKCRLAIQKHWLQHRPSLFQHIGIHSSLKGKVQKLKEKGFGRSSPLQAAIDRKYGGSGHLNPPANLYTNLKVYKEYSLLRAYNGAQIFWAYSPKKDDSIVFNFTAPIVIEKWYLRSGNYEHHDDRAHNTSIWMKPLLKVDKIIDNLRKNSRMGNDFNSSGQIGSSVVDTNKSNQKDVDSNRIPNLYDNIIAKAQNDSPASVSSNQIAGNSMTSSSKSDSIDDSIDLDAFRAMPGNWIQVGSFKKNGIAEGSCKYLGPVTAMKLLFETDLKNWILLNEV